MVSEQWHKFIDINRMEESEEPVETSPNERAREKQNEKQAENPSDTNWDDALCNDSDVSDVSDVWGVLEVARDKTLQKVEIAKVQNGQQSITAGTATRSRLDQRGGSPQGHCRGLDRVRGVPSPLHIGVAARNARMLDNMPGS